MESTTAGSKAETMEASLAGTKDYLMAEQLVASMEPLTESPKVDCLVTSTVDWKVFSKVDS